MFWHHDAHMMLFVEMRQDGEIFLYYNIESTLSCLVIMMT